MALVGGEEDGSIEARLGSKCSGSLSLMHIFFRDAGGEAAGSVGGTVRDKTSKSHSSMHISSR